MKTSRPTRFSIRRCHGIAACALVTIVLVACGDDSPDAETESDGPQAVPSPGIEVFTGGEFDDIALPGGASEVGTKSEIGGAIAQSFGVRATSPEGVMDFFGRSLSESGWVVVEPVSSTGTNALDGSWERDGRRLEISAVTATGVADEDTQFSVVLLDSTVPGADVNDLQPDG